MYFLFVNISLTFIYSCMSVIIIICWNKERSFFIDMSSYF